MKIVIAPDSYKGSLSAQAAAEAMAEGIARALPDAVLLQSPMGDGGEGTLAALISSTGAVVRYANVSDAYGGIRRAAWGWHSKSATAYVELAEACGLQYTDIQQGSILDGTTYGVGQLIRESLDIGAKNLVLTLGGSATNDAGAGILTALGGRLLDENGLELPPRPRNFSQIASIDISNLDGRLKHLRVVAAVDVDNPLLGPNGASSIYGPQKGASPSDVDELESALACFSGKLGESIGNDYRENPGAGAAGGVGFAAKAILNADLKSGIDVVMDQVDFLEIITDADLVITGEGRLDGQSLSGKTPIGISRCASKMSIPVVVVAGQLGNGWRSSYEHGVTAAFSLTDGPMDLKEALGKTGQLLSDRCESVARLVFRESSCHHQLTKSLGEGFIIVT
ncbi:glycerate kinase [Billgrantia endophytica]|uniref:Glycerate kinase n=1 Tax=Billgrantia endophytica TaxID=2033802 RepID=A0A2N7U2Y7_9GAMM|nr:glycerate kinase [Halomonas endophytica]PMR74791.1 glycerate kinase [Halomonas endophytica]